jgi:hypothetical protein
MAMCEMARDNDIEGITRLLDEDVDPAADTERDGYAIRFLDDPCLSMVPSFLRVWMSGKCC